MKDLKLGILKNRFTHQCGHDLLQIWRTDISFMQNTSEAEGSALVFKVNPFNTVS